MSLPVMETATNVMKAVLGSPISIRGLCKNSDVGSRGEWTAGKLKHHSDEDELREEILFYVRSEQFWQGVQDDAAASTRRRPPVQMIS